MRKIVFTIIAILLTVLVTAQNRSATLTQTTLNATGETFKDVFFNASDTIDDNDTYFVQFTAKKNNRSIQDVYLAGSAVSGSGDIVITVYGKKFEDSDWSSSLGTTTWDCTQTLDEVISITTANAYRYFKVAYVGDGTEKRALVTDLRFKMYLVGESLSSSSLTLSGALSVGTTLTVTGESTFNNHINLGAGDDLLGSTTSDINIGSGNFTVAGATGAMDVDGAVTLNGTVAVGDATTDITTLNGSITSNQTLAAAATPFYFRTSLTATSGDHNNMRVRGQNQATSASTSDLRGLYAQATTSAGKYGGSTTAIYANAIAKGTSTTTNLRGILIDVESEGTPTLISNMYGLYIRNKSTVAVASDNYSMVIDNEKMGGGIVQDAAIQIKTTTWGADVTAFTYGIDMSSTGAFGTADIRLQNGALVDNSTTSLLTITEATVAIAGALTSTGGISLTANVTQYTAEVTLTATEIVGTASGDVGHVDGAILVAAPGSGFAHQFVSVFFVYDFGVAAYTGGADDAIIQVGVNGAQVTVSSAITGANLLEAAGDKMLGLGSTATELVFADNGVISLYGTALTDPGTAVGTLRCYVTYNVITTGL